MRTKLQILVLAGLVGWTSAGCNSLDMTTLGDPDHREDHSELVLLRIRVKDQPAPHIRIMPRDRDGGEG